MLFKEKGSYTLTATITNELGKVITAQNSITVYPVAEIKLTLPTVSHTDKTMALKTETKEADGLTVTYTLIRNGESAETGAFIEGTLSDGSIRFKEKGVYALTASVTDATGRVFSDTANITVYPVSYTHLDAVQTQYAPISAERLINMTHSMTHCQVAYEAHDDQALGKFYADNDFVPALEKVSDEVYAYLDFGKIGKEMREGEGGVFTPCGYVVQNGEIAVCYHSGDASPLDKPDYACLLYTSRCV